MPKTLSKTELLVKKEELQKEIEQIDHQLFLIENLEKPFVACVSAYSGHYQMQFKTEDQARKKLSFYASKKYFKNGLNYGVYMYRWNPNGTKTLLEEIPLGDATFKAKVS